MKRLLLATALVLATPFAYAGQASPAQVDALMKTMDMPKMVDGIFSQMEQSMQQIAGTLLPENATDADRVRLRELLARQQAMVRQEMSWEKLGPVYRTVYLDVFSAEEVTAMNAFYASPEGRSILQKMPQVMSRATQALQPVTQALMQRAMQDVQDEMAKDARGR